MPRRGKGTARNASTMALHDTVRTVRTCSASEPVSAPAAKPRVQLMPAKASQLYARDYAHSCPNCDGYCPKCGGAVHDALGSSAHHDGSPLCRGARPVIGEYDYTEPAPYSLMRPADARPLVPHMTRGQWLLIRDCVYKRHGVMPGQQLSDKFKAKLLAECRAVAEQAQAYARELEARKRPEWIKDLDARAEMVATLTDEARAARNLADAVLHAATNRMRPRETVATAERTRTRAVAPAAPVQLTLTEAARDVMRDNKFFTRGTD